MRTKNADARETIYGKLTKCKKAFDIHTRKVHNKENGYEQESIKKCSALPYPPFIPAAGAVGGIRNGDRGTTAAVYIAVDDNRSKIQEEDFFG